MDSDPHFWARRYTLFRLLPAPSGAWARCSGSAWGSFPAQAYLALAYLGMTATEFIARSVHRPAYTAHTVLALGPLIAAAADPGRALSPIMTAVLVVFFGAVLISYCPGMARLIDEGLLSAQRKCRAGAAAAARKERGHPGARRAQASALAKSAFIANICHELRTPMNALLGMAQLLERAELPKQQADHVKVMLEAGRGLQTLLDDVIALTRDDDDALEDEDCDPLQTARAVARLLQPRAWEKRLQLTLTAAPDLPRVAADPRRVRQVLLKLADNALKFTEHGLVDIRLDLDRNELANRWCASPSPTPARAWRRTWRIFCSSLFRPAIPPMRASEQGAGLGLAVAKRIIEQAGGDIGFESTPGEGALFWFTLPVSGQTSAGAQAGSRPQIRRRCRRTACRS